MRKINTLCLAFALSATTLLPMTSFAASCGQSTMPKSPQIPAAEQRNANNMLEAQASVRSFVADSRKHLRCVNHTKQHNRLVDEVYAVADAYNEALQEFKASTR